MKRTLIALSAAAAAFLTFPSPSPAATAPPNAAQMAPLAYLVGTWHCRWTAGKDSGTEDQIFETALGGAWLAEKEVIVDASGQSVVESIHYTGYDPQKQAYMHVGPDADGSYEVATSTDTHEWREVGGSTTEFLHTKISDTERTASEPIETGGKTVMLQMTCRKAP